MIKNNQITYKIILLGESSVGKTSIITRLTQDKYLDTSLSTFSGYYTEKILEVNNIPVRLEIWDTAGQEKYRSLARNYYKGCHAAILVYDITDKSSFEEIINYWYNEIKENCPDIVIGIAANKFDLFEMEQISEKEGKKLAEEINAVFHSTSAKESVGIDVLFFDIAQKLLERNDRTISFNDSLMTSKLSMDYSRSKKKCC